MDEGRMGTVVAGDDCEQSITAGQARRLLAAGLIHLCRECEVLRTRSASTI